MRDEFQPTTWEACRQYVVHGRKAEEVAADLEMTLGAVRVAQHRVLKALKIRVALSVVLILFLLVSYSAGWIAPDPTAGG